MFWPSIILGLVGGMTVLVYTPTQVETSEIPSSCETSTGDIYHRLLAERIIFLGQEVTEAVANNVVESLLYLDKQAPSQPIYLYINSPGGSVTAGMTIYDTMRGVEAPVCTINFGLAASMSALLLAAGEPGCRFALPDSHVLIHQPSAGAADQEAIASAAERLNQLMAELTGQSVETIRQDTTQDYFMSSEEALNYGIIDQIISEASNPISPQ